MGKKLAIDKGLRNLINKHFFELCMIVVLAAAVFIRVSLLPNTDLSPDYETYYKAWVEHYRQYGLVKGLEFAPGDYYVPFNIIYWLCSLLPVEPWLPLGIIPGIFEAISAFFIYKIFYLLTGRRHHSVFAGILTLFLPFVVFNGALWKQVDAVYTCFLVISLYHLLKENYRWAFVFYGIAFAFKLQAIIFLPILVILYLTEGYATYSKVSKDDSDKKSFSILEFLWIPAIYLIAGLPEVLCRHGIRATYLAYFDQAGELSSEGYGMVSYFPNLYNWGFDDYDALLSKAAILLLLVVLVFIAFVCYRYRDAMDRSMVVYLAIWIGMTCLMLLPGMHERYDYAVLLILTPYAILSRKQIIWPMILVNLCSLACYGRALFRADIIPMYIVTFAYAVAYFWITVDVLGILAAKRRD